MNYQDSCIDEIQKQLLRDDQMLTKLDQCCLQQNQSSQNIDIQKSMVHIRIVIRMQEKLNKMNPKWILSKQQKITELNEQERCINKSLENIQLYYKIYQRVIEKIKQNGANIGLEPYQLYLILNKVCKNINPQFTSINTSMITILARVSQKQSFSQDFWLQNSNSSNILRTNLKFSISILIKVNTDSKSPKSSTNQNSYHKYRLNISKIKILRHFQEIYKIQVVMLRLKGEKQFIKQKKQNKQKKASAKSYDPIKIIKNIPNLSSIDNFLNFFIKYSVVLFFRIFYLYQILYKIHTSQMKFQEKLNTVQNKLFINGQLIDSDSSLFQVINPADQSVIGTAVAASQNQVNLAVQSAHKAFKGPWKTMNDSERGKILYRFADLLQQNIQWLAYFETLNTGKPISISLNQDLPFTVSTYRYFAGVTDKIKGNTLSMTKPMFAMTKKQPIGVVGQIIPWNYPLLMMAWKVAPALAAGCTIVIKPAQQTPYSALMIGQLFNRAGLPPGVINIITGFGQTGANIAQHKLVRKVSFTGSTEVGYIVMKQSHKHALKPITLELGGKSANIILPDSDLDKAIQQACIVFSNAGQSCVAGSRTFVHSSIYQKFIQKAKAFAQSIKVGDPMSQQTQQGAVISQEQFNKILGYLKSGKQQGARLITGGDKIGNKGYYIKPTVFADVEDHMKIAKQQIFGPVMCIFKWANSLPYGLGAGIVTKDVSKVLKFSEKLQAGTIYVNCYDCSEGSTPFGGYKDSGIGKDLGDEGIQSYLLTKTVIINPDM